jgi:predicted nucleic acid-binding protein
MTDSVFVDTNVLIYFRDASESEKQPVAERWLKELWRNRTGRTSVQVLNEYYVAVTQKLKPGMPREAAREDVRALYAWDPVALSYPLIERAWAIEERHGLSWWDSLVVAAAQVSRSSVLLTEDLQDGLVIGGTEVINPFLHADRLPGSAPL